jgi:hypothetical protein
MRRLFLRWFIFGATFRSILSSGAQIKFYRTAHGLLLGELCSLALYSLCVMCPYCLCSLCVVFCLSVVYYFV